MEGLEKVVVSAASIIEKGTDGCMLGRIIDYPGAIVTGKMDDDYKLHVTFYRASCFWRPAFTLEGTLERIFKAMGMLVDVMRYSSTSICGFVSAEDIIRGGMELVCYLASRSIEAEQDLMCAMDDMIGSEPGANFCRAVEEVDQAHFTACDESGDFAYSVVSFLHYLSTLRDIKTESWNLIRSTVLISIEPLMVKSETERNSTLYKNIVKRAYDNAIRIEV